MDSQPTPCQGAGAAGGHGHGRAHAEDLGKNDVLFPQAVTDDFRARSFFLSLRRGLSENFEMRGKKF